ncbi:hypothetical protein [Litchfieldia alkalitelluris]|uniref:hypothetical protein n=1 Tax=Litchfieldia alkalitelluris TaxID=304268 RepID=UPI0009971904|nr:hypothetical protein [Litchfieldia alkalitelluris]
MESLVTTNHVIEEIDSILRVTVKIEQQLSIYTNEAINHVTESYLQEMNELSHQLRKIDGVLNETTHEKIYARKNNSNRLIYKLSY